MNLRTGDSVHRSLHISLGHTALHGSHFVYGQAGLYIMIYLIYACHDNASLMIAGMLLAHKTSRRKSHHNAFSSSASRCALSEPQPSKLCLANRPQLDRLPLVLRCVHLQTVNTATLVPKPSISAK